MILTIFTIILYSVLSNEKSAPAYRFCSMAKCEGTFKKCSSLRDYLQYTVSFLSSKELNRKLWEMTHIHITKKLCKNGCRSHVMIII